METVETENAALTVLREDPSSYTTSPIVRIIVGEDEKTSRVHKALLIKYSPYFEACLNPKFEEGRNLEIRWPEQDHFAFDGFMSWLLNRNLSNVNILREDHFSDSIKLYQLADKLMIPDFKNVIMDNLRSALRILPYKPSPSHIIQVHEVGLLDSKLGQFLLHGFVWNINIDAWYYYQEGFDHESDISQCKELKPLYEQSEVAVAVLKHMMKFACNEWKNPAYAKNCVYHEHADGSLCPPVYRAHHQQGPAIILKVLHGFMRAKDDNPPYPDDGDEGEEGVAAVLDEFNISSDEDDSGPF